MLSGRLAQAARYDLNPQRRAAIPQGRKRLVTTKSTSRLRQFEHRQRSFTAASRDHPATSPSRSASRFRRQFQQAPVLRLSASERQRKRLHRRSEIEAASASSPGPTKHASDAQSAAWMWCASTPRHSIQPNPGHILVASWRGSKRPERASAPAVSSPASRTVPPSGSSQPGADYGHAEPL
jgi:hypothetical protein